MNEDNFFTISCHGNENITWINEFSDNFKLYIKDSIDTSSFDNEKIEEINNVGYNIYSYMKFIIDNYDNLPEITVFCKNNVFPRHVTKDVFIKQSSRKIFTCIEQPSRWELKYPVTMLSSDNGFLELNTSWYTSHHPTKYFSNFNDFYRFIFKHKDVPRYLRFAPGGNYVVPRENILLRSKEFYQNLMTFVEHHQFSGESHMIERALYIIWNSTIEESNTMTRVLSDNDLKALIESIPKISLLFKIKNKIYILLHKIVDTLTGKIFQEKEINYGKNI
jgi:hypothetical protein